METIQDPPVPFFQRMQAKLAESRFFTFSLLLHIIILVLVGGIVVVSQMQDPTDFAAEGGSGLVNEEVAATTPPAEPETQPTQVFTPTQPQVTTPTLDMITTNSTAPTTFQMQAAVPTIKAPATADMNEALNKVIRSAAGTGLSRLPGVMGGRAGGTARMALMKKNDMKDKSEKAVLAGLRWLKEHQNSDGSWSNDKKSSMTGLAVLCFLGHGETPESIEFGPTVKKGVDWLLNTGTENQGKLSQHKDGFPNPAVYEHAIGTYALGEYYSMTKDDRVKDVLMQAVNYIVQGQAPDGGWQYGYAKGNESDTSVSGWQIQALKAAHLTELNISGVDEALDKSMENLKRVQGPKGDFGYHNPGDARPSLAGVGVLCTYFWRGEKEKSVRDGIKFILEDTEKDNPVEYKGAKANLYAWYYNTQACLMFGGQAWSKWNHWFQDQITDNQSPDGSWPKTGNPKNIGGFETGEGTGQVYRTTMCVLMLEVYYRYMPTNRS